MCTRSPISTARTRFLPSATATSMSATRCAHRSLFNTPNLSRSAYVRERRERELRRLRPLRRKLPAGAVKLGQKLCTKDGYIEYPVRNYQTMSMGAGKVEHRLPRQEPHQLLQYRYLAVQDGLPSAHRGAGLSEACRAGQVPRSLAAHQARKSVPRGLRPHLQPPLRGCLHARYGRSAVAIDEVKRFIAQQDLNAEMRFVPEKVIPKVDGEFSEKIAVIGGGLRACRAHTTSLKRATARRCLKGKHVPAAC